MSRRLVSVVTCAVAAMNTSFSLASLVFVMLTKKSAACSVSEMVSGLKTSKETVKKSPHHTV